MSFFKTCLLSAIASPINSFLNLNSLRFLCATTTRLSKFYKYHPCSSLPSKAFINPSANMSKESKKLKSEPLKIGTHNGRFHCDEALACFLLQKLEKYQNAEIVRSRDPAVFDICDIVVDVGGVFDKATNKFDHHQRSFEETLSSLRPELGSNYDIRLSSAGLIYTYFGEEVIANIVKKHKEAPLPADSLRLLYKKIYENFIREIDAIDNGVQICDGEPRYQIRTHVSARLDKLNPSWDHEGPVDENALFEQAKDLVGTEFTESVIFYANSWLPARDIVKEAIENSKNIYATGEILELSRPCPWKEHLSELEDEYKIVGVPKYVLMADTSNDWRVICVPRQPNSFICRKFLHKDWRGTRAEQLQEISEVTDATFCHSTGFVGGAKSRDGVFQMAVKSLQGDYVD